MAKIDKQHSLTIKTNSPEWFKVSFGVYDMISIEMMSFNVCFYELLTLTVAMKFFDFVMILRTMKRFIFIKSFETLQIFDWYLRDQNVKVLISA